MKSRQFLWVAILAMLVFGGSRAWANGVDPDEPIEFVPYPNTALIDPDVNVEVIYNSVADTFTYTYSVYVKPSSALPLFDFEVLTAAEIISDEALHGFSAMVFQDVGQRGPFEVSFGSKTVENMPQPGDTMDGCVAVSTGFPCVTVTLTKGDIAPPSGQQVILPPTEAQGPVTWETGKAKVLSVGPFKKDPELSSTGYVDFIAEQAAEALPLGWHQASLGIEVSLSSIRAKVSAGQDPQAAVEILALMDVLEGARGQGLTDNGYFLLRPNLERLLTLMETPPPDPTTETLNVSKDSILSQQNPHRNEGANDLLQLSHRPEEKNKSNNPIIAFDLANVNLTGLRKARLVLNIQECEQPKKWGPEGRNILAYPVNEEWVEGNGETIKTGQGEKTRGTGQGVTWFSPIDENIANKVPNGALQWSGARPFLGPLTAAPVLITNKQVGTIEFDVTQDVKSGFTDGWLVRKQDEAAFGNVRFYSKEGAAGNQALAPKLILEYNGPTAQAPSRSLLSIVLQLVEQGYRQLQADRDAPGSGLSWLGRWWPA